jgi:glycosyltransferase involved in cell wall biosynthesis
VTDAELYALYRTASVFLCMSEHEGFCIPLLEAIYFRVPVIAYAAAAIPETLAGTGILMHEKDHIAIAEMVDEVCRDKRLNDAITEKQLTRLDDFSPGAVEQRLKKVLSPWLLEDKKTRIKWSGVKNTYPSLNPYYF